MLSVFAISKECRSAAGSSFLRGVLASLEQLKREVTTAVAFRCTAEIRQFFVGSDPDSH